MLGTDEETYGAEEIWGRKGESSLHGWVLLLVGGMWLQPYTAAAPSHWS